MLSGKNIVVTDCLSELGKQTLAAMAENGANIYACGCKCTGEFERYCKILEEENHVRINPVCFDMSDNDEVDAAIKKIYVQSGGGYSWPCKFG